MKQRKDLKALKENSMDIKINGIDVEVSDIEAEQIKKDLKLINEISKKKNNDKEIQD